MPLSLSPAAALESRIASRQARIGIIGMGYVGLPLTLLFSEQGFRVTGFDVDASKVEALNAGGSYIVRIPGTEIVKAKAAGFRATGAYSEIGEMDSIIICVPTPWTIPSAGPGSLSRLHGRLLPTSARANW